MGWYGASCFEFIGKSMETEKTTWSQFPDGGKAIVEQILASEEINKSKRARMWESQSGIQVGKLTIWVRSFETEVFVPCQCNYELRGNNFLERRVKSVRYGTESISSLAPKIWEILPNEIKDSDTLQIFKAKIKSGFQ